jgi:hypothetical protein
MMYVGVSVIRHVTTRYIMKDLSLRLAILASLVGIVLGFVDDSEGATRWVVGTWGILLALSFILLALNGPAERRDK